MTRKSGPLFASQQHLGVPPRFSLDRASLPSSPGLVGLIETPVNPKLNRQALIDDTPIKSRLPASDGPTRSTEPTSGHSVSAAGVEFSKPTSIYERLGWDDGDFDDL